MSSSSYVIRYFGVPGLAEASRLMLLASNSSWTEETPEWPQEKPNQPFGRLPVLVEKRADGGPDFVLCESGTIERYLARTFGFFPSDPKKAALQEQLHDQMADVTTAYSQIRNNASDSAKEKFNELLVKLKEILPKALENNGSSISPQSNGLTYIDMCVYSFFKHMIIFTLKFTPEYIDNILDAVTPEVTKLISIVIAEPSLQSRVADDKKVFTFLA
ncbi:hypothetical protein IW140_006230 [Coemansia sp. RSA 1813]|nr:hypothetical protein EV178_005661 [Coemansia sp. RSA 1646]KAJ1766220.1 hypothetical protein LPJ74_005994 [Coemansia sp. RSA 1843]KAJ2092253.1 hypothetical protein IW138_001324 [Coemansia sp. RSA 986]KAJ2211300.1 hypothetical protein EV179_005613 [Coemansia sp. RSA 487]KAJ2563116.1 hypothetical protein IW140_006230 [Coemansia sp. RSA 1813]